jgi:acyl-coenzyme A thioesterase PaaI-like protein
MSTARNGCGTLATEVLVGSGIQNRRKRTCGGAAATTVPEGMDVITVENKVSFLRPASSHEMFCHGTVLRSGKTLVFVEAEIVVKRDGEAVAVAKASSTLAVIPRRSPSR